MKLLQYTFSLLLMLLFGACAYEYDMDFLKKSSEEHEQYSLIPYSNEFVLVSNDDISQKAIDVANIMGGAASSNYFEAIVVEYYGATGSLLYSNELPYWETEHQYTIPSAAETAKVIYRYTYFNLETDKRKTDDLYKTYWKVAAADLKMTEKVVEEKHDLIPSASGFVLVSRDEIKSRADELFDTLEGKLPTVVSNTFGGTTIQYYDKNGNEYTTRYVPYWEKEHLYPIPADALTAKAIYHFTCFDLETEVRKTENLYKSYWTVEADDLTMTSLKNVNSGNNNDNSKGEGTQASPYNVSAALKLAKSLGTDVASSNVYVEGIVSRSPEVSVAYGNATFYISDEGTTSEELLVYHANYYNGEKFTSTNQLKSGDKVVVLGKLLNYNGTTLEISQCQIVSINGATKADTGGGEKGGGNTGATYSYGDYLYIIGPGNNWSFNDYLAKGEDGVYTGYAYLADYFKLCVENNYDHQLYPDPSSHTLSMTESYKSMSGLDGYYEVVVDTKRLTYSITVIKTIGLIGTAVPPYDWSRATPMTYNKNSRVWELKGVKLNDGEIKFIANNSWDISWGRDSSGKLSRKGSNISVAAGTYDISLYAWCDGKGYYTFTRK